MTNEEYITRIVEQDEDFCIITDEVNGTVNIEVSLDWWKKQSNSDEDCISREEVCDYIAEFVNHEYATDREREMVKHIIGGIQHLPSIQPTAKENLVIEDCISRADAIANIRILYPDMPVVDIMGARHKWSEKYQQYRDCEKILADSPSIQPTTKENLVVEDCISRAELLKAVDTWDKFGCDANNKLVRIKDCYVPYIRYDDVVKAIKGMPSIQPMRPKGEWLKDEYGIYCSNCQNGVGIGYKFCPCCGADMRGE